MDYKHTDFDQSVNCPKTSVLKELVVYFGGFIILIAVLYLSLGLIANIIAPLVPPKIEREMVANLVSQKLLEKANDPVKGKYLQSLLDSIPKKDLPDYGGYKIYLIKDPKPNAFALAGGYIFVTEGMLKILDSENALVFVLGHELGHFKNHDPLRRFGKGLVWGLVQLLFLGETTSVMSQSLDTYELSLSRTQEEEADVVGLELLIAKYGHAGGADKFFSEMKKDDGPQILKYSSTHPYSAKRIKTLEKLIKKRGYKIEPVKKLVI